MATTVTTVTTSVPSIDYTTRDYTSTVADIIRVIPFYCPEWTDNNDSDFGIGLSKGLAGAFDVLHFYVDRAAGEMFLPTAVKRESVVKILKLIGYELASVIPASADVVFTLGTPLASALTIPEGFQVQTVAGLTESPVVFETEADLVIPSGQLSGTVTVVEGVTSSEDLGTSNGQAYQEIPVQSSIIIESSFVFQVDEGAGFVSWNLQPSLVNSAPTDKDYTIELDANELITVFLGDNFQGHIPVSGASMQALFRLIQGDRGGVFGNVGANTITVPLSQVLYGGTPVTLNVTNPQQASGGEDVESIDDAKILGPASLRALNRAVTAEDYKTLAEQFGGVAKALIAQGTGGTDPCCACNLDLFIAPTGGGVLASASKTNLLNYLDGLKMVGTCIQIEDPTYVGITVNGTATVVSNVDLSTVQDAVTAASSSFFDLAGDFADFGRDLFLSQLFAQFQGINGIDHIDIVQCSRVPAPVYAIWTGNGTISTPTVGPASQDETWTITFLTPTTFSVQGSMSGIQPNGTVGTPYATPNQALAFTITAGLTAQGVGDRITFTTSAYLGNVPIDTTEIMAAGPVSFQFVVIPARLTGVNC